MNTIELKDFILNNSINDSEDSDRKCIDIILESGVAINISIKEKEFNKINEEIFCSVIINIADEVSNFVKPQNIDSAFTDYLFEKNKNTWDGNVSILMKIMSVQAVPDYIRRKDSYTFEIAEKNEANSEFYKEIQDFMQEKIFRCPAVPKDFISDEAYEELDEGKYARYKLVSLEKINRLIDFNGGIVIENKINRRPKMK